MDDKDQRRNNSWPLLWPRAVNAPCHKTEVPQCKRQHSVARPLTLVNWLFLASSSRLKCLLVGQHVADANMLGLLAMWILAPVSELCEDEGLSFSASFTPVVCSHIAFVTAVALSSELLQIDFLIRLEVGDVRLQAGQCLEG